MTQRFNVQPLQPHISVLSEEGVKAIHKATLEILEETGVEMQDPQGRELLLEAGARESDGRLKIPEKLVDEALSSAPSLIPIYDRLGNLAMPLELGNVFFGSGSDTNFTFDVITGERRRTTTQDVENLARLCDGLENIDFVMSMGNPSDVPPDDLFLHAFIRMIRGSVKPNVYVTKDRKDMEDIYRIAVAVAGGEDALREKPFFLHYAEPISPLLIPEESLQKIIFCAEKGIPACYPPSPNTGGGGPISLAGAVALGNAECLVGLIISQLTRRGTPFLYGMNTAAMDMKTAIVSYGSPEWSLGMAAWTDLARFYNLPSWGFGGASDSKLVDAQAGLEATFSIMSAFLSRCTLVHDVGYLEFGSTSSAEMLVIADEIIRMTRFLVNGLAINDKTLALDAIARVRPGGGFLADDHTLENWKWAQWTPKVIDRKLYHSWVEAGSKDMFVRANDVAREALEKHEVPPLQDEVEAVIADVLAERADGHQ
ncbi:MAG: trimethylamine methyltransferase family protein [Anaerolineales bacterium]|nr:trimethylamine methyltransferase family protein [Anaerolineales bacterium]